MKRVQIPKENGKMRNLGMPTVTDRIIQQVIVQVISPIFEKQFNDNSFGFRTNRISEQAVIRALEYLNDGYEWIVDIDLLKLAYNCANTWKGYYQICKTRYIQFTINNERLRKGGLVFLLDQYTKVHIECTN